MDGTERAAAAFKAVCDYMDEAKLKYECKKESNIAFVTVIGKNFPVSLMVSVNAKTQRAEIYAQLPFGIKRQREFDVLTKLSQINSEVACGKFCLYSERNLCTFEGGCFISGAESFTSRFGKALIAPAYSVIEEYADGIYAVNKGN